MLLGIGVPLVAVGTFAQPLGRLVAAILAGVDGLNFGHGRFYSRKAVAIARLIIATLMQ
jgi:hypothetical protein